MNRTCRPALLALALLGATGCGGREMGTVTGRVTVGGAPVKEGMIMFHPTNGPTAVGSIKDGVYSLTTTKPDDGAVVGEHRVTITATTVGAGKLVEPKSMEEEVARAEKKNVKWLVAGEVKWVVPQKCSQLDTTDQKAIVAAGPNTIDFDFPTDKK